VLDALVAEARLRWGLDLADGLQVLATETLVRSPLEPARPALLVPAAILRLDDEAVAARRTHPEDLAPVLPGRHGPGRDDPVAVLRRLYPADHPVGRFGAAEGLTIGELTADALSGPLYLAPVARDAAFASPWAMPWISHRLRLPDGCPWDREQTHESLRNHLLEEAYEVYDALADGATPALAEELGDLLLQVILHAQLAAEAGVFDLTDVEATLSAKIVRRHPHVFGDAEARTASDVNRQWERIKADERKAAGEATGAAADESPRKGALDGVSRSLPALAASQEMQDRAAHIGYEWPSVEGVLDKVHEEVAELRAAATPAEQTEEYGDLLFVLVNVARWQGIEAEAALRNANDKFRRRFASVERQAFESGVALKDLSFEQLDALWDAAKVEEKAQHHARDHEKEIAR
jgi:tetrapyrrole methylase family protein/MazG family protein